MKYSHLVNGIEATYSEEFETYYLKDGSTYSSKMNIWSNFTTAENGAKEYELVMDYNPTITKILIIEMRNND